MPKTITPETATAAHAAPISRTLARAFVDDPMMLSFFTDDATREDSLARYFSTLFTRQYVLHGLCERTDAAAAFWVPAEAQEKAVPDAATIEVLTGILGERAAQFGAAVETAAHHAPQEPHWSLALIGADPEARGQGHGSALLRSGLAQADAAGQPVYLESSKPTNIPVYEHFGFRVREEFDLPGGGPTLWGMWREPQEATGK
ncbi:GCN5-like N-acetyltransferase [Streptomyces spiroverticillatus]|uniref:GCN5-like N-acetyltransferase n=1 Tax=Streptomyces finlayi TaxID=67296 RepID=A0A918X091_9ACTN|nr:GNAT family N-acetyltransferase [Streptomyces finlayi]GHA16771.1 GCN5-like N-acetyltransferase [Streptomyces spiroverticillatus]GHC98923.1 GCN5-like N-acetyltransferase [Streptomyces finlayi]